MNGVVLGILKSCLSITTYLLGLREEEKIPRLIRLRVFYVTVLNLSGWSKVSHAGHMSDSVFVTIKINRSSKESTIIWIALILKD